MTSLTDQFLKRLRENVLERSTSPTPPTTSPMQNGESSNAASSAEPHIEETMKIRMTRKGEDLESVAYALGAAFGVIAVGVAVLLISAYVIQLILSATGLVTLTYAQVVGLLGIWEIVKPRSDSK